MTSIALAREMDDKSKDEEIGKINIHLRSLMDILHTKGIN